MDRHYQRPAITDVKTLVVKIGTTVLIDDRTHELKLLTLQRICRDLASLARAGVSPVIVSSGAVGLGARELGTKQIPTAISPRQALAAIGQPGLMKAWRQGLAGEGLKAAQVLLDQNDLSDHQRFLNARKCLEQLLQWNVIPVVNENDTVSWKELQFGDNDILSAGVAGMVDAQLLLIMSRHDGLYTDDPGRPGAEHIAEVREVNHDIEQHCATHKSRLGTGGMLTKVRAAKIATEMGIATIVASGDAEYPLSRVFEGNGHGTFFAPLRRVMRLRERRIYSRLRDSNVIKIDAGAVAALCEGKNLFPSGIVEVEGEFNPGDAVTIIDPEGAEVGCGITVYGAAELERIRGKKGHQIEAALGYKYSDEVVEYASFVRTRR